MCKLGVPTSVCGSGIKAQFHIDYSKTSFYLQGETLNRTNYIFYIFILRCSTVWFVFSGDVLPLLIHSPPASYSCYSEHIAPLGASPPLQFLPCPCAPSIQRSHPFHLLPWWLMLATVRPSGWSALADSSPRLMEDASVQINVGRPKDAGISSQLAWPQFLGLNGYWFGSCILIICVGPCSITGVAA